jgi:hypothetical protein
MKGMLATGESRKSLGALEQMKSAIGGAYEQVRAALVGLSEPVPGADDFAYKLNASLEEMRRVTFLPITLEIADSSALALPRLVQAQAIHIVREALVNTHKHAQAPLGHASDAGARRAHRGNADGRIGAGSGDTRGSILPANDLNYLGIHKPIHVETYPESVAILPSCRTTCPSSSSSLSLVRFPATADLTLLVPNRSNSAGHPVSSFHSSLIHVDSPSS